MGREDTIRIKEDGEREEISSRVAQLREAMADTTNVADRRHIENRIASLCGGIGVISVGGATDLEQKELYERVDEAVGAVKSAMEEGILAGGGLTLYRIGQGFLEHNEKDSDLKTAREILGRAMQTPMAQIYSNAGKVELMGEYAKDVSNMKRWKYGYNVKNNEYGNLIKMGVIDPAKVTRCALENAVSVAVTILSTNAIITFDEGDR